MHDSYQSKARFEQEIQDRLGLVPSFYLSAPAAPDILQRFWAETIDCYLDNPLPSVFKERLIVYLSRFASARYCVVRHAGYLLGGEHGYPSGDRTAEPHEVGKLLALLRSAVPTADNLQAALALLLTTPAEAALPSPGDPLEQAMFIACGALYLDGDRKQQVRDALVHVMGRQLGENLFALIAYVARQHFWAGLHEEIAIEPDMRLLLEQQPELAGLLLRREEVTPLAAAPGPTVAPGPDQRDAAHQRFVSLFSHELRNPVAAISAVSDMFQVVGMADDRLRSASNILHRQVQALGQTLERMVDLSGLLYGDTRLAHAPVVLDDMISGVLRDMAPRLEEKGIVVELQSAEARACVMGDAPRLAQMMENLLLHGLKVSRPPHPLRIVVSTQAQQAVVAVSDHGPGFTASPLPEPGAPDGRGKVPVTLMTVRAIAHLHHGTVRAESAGPGLGSTTTVTLPLATGAARPHGAAAAAGTDASDKQRMRVLAIEDNRDFAQLFRHMLEVMGCDLDIRPDARSGLERAREILPELIFCDIGLPGEMDGFAFARAVRSDPVLAPIPLVAVSGYSSPADVQHAMEAGFNRVCGKPVKFADISDALATFASRQSGAA
jgi:signal transduction histidine kinase/ActR/RegA family two-component response regulator